MFDWSKFEATPFEDRTRRVPVPDLASWFDNGAEPVWVVRGLTGPELGQVREALAAASTRDAALQALVGAAKKEEAVQAFRDLFGTSDDLPRDYVRMLEMILLGSIEPTCNRQQAVLLGINKPGEFNLIAQAITELTGMGRDPGESNGSGATPASEPPSISGISTDDASSSSDPTSSPPDSSPTTKPSSGRGTTKKNVAKPTA